MLLEILGVGMESGELAFLTPHLSQHTPNSGSFSLFMLNKEKKYLVSLSLCEGNFQIKIIIIILIQCMNNT
jgi:hypothetical protein